MSIKLLKNDNSSFCNFGCINFNNQSITDNETASFINYPKPASIDTITTWFDNNVKEGKYFDYKLNEEKEVTKLNFKVNNISFKGASQLLEYAINNLQYLEEIDLSYNKLGKYFSFKTERWKEDQDYIAFENILEKLLSISIFKIINLKVNELDVNWYKYIISKFSDEMILKIHFI